ncbi:hypothetical protein OG900_08890 [Streptomyces sp. NBC_00433]
MDPISVGLLAALAGGAGGEVGRQAWAGLGAVVRRPFRRRGVVRPGEVSGEAVPGTGEVELAALAQAPADPGRARALGEVLVRRAAADEEFAQALELWHRQARAVEGGSVSSTVSGGTQYGPVLQGRDFSGITFTTTTPPPPSSPAPPAAPEPGPGPEQGAGGSSTPGR